MDTSGASKADKAAHAPFDEPRLVGSYELLRVLGEGGIATTYLGRDLNSGRLVAVKALQLLRTKHREQIALFEREALALRDLDHPQIPDFYGIVVQEGAETFTLHLAQEFIEGRSLADMLDTDYPFDDAEVIDIMLSCLEPLAYLHSRQPPLYHRDIKPSNIIRKANGTCVLVDFGAVREALADPRDAASSVVGTFGYMAPEQFQARCNAATDLYSLGATALHLISGRSPKSFDVKRLKPDFHGSIEMDPHLGAILDLLLEPVDEDRYQSVAALRRALERWTNDHSAVSAPLPAAAPVSITSSVTRSPIISVDADPVPAPVPVRRDAPPSAPAPVLSERTSPADPPERPTPPETALEAASPKTLRRPSGPTRRAPTGYPGRLASGESTHADVPIRRTRDSWWRVLYPPARGYNQVGLVFLVLAAMLIVLWRVRALGAVPPLVAGLFTAFGVAYFAFDWAAKRRDRPMGLIGTTDGRLARVDLTTTALGERYLAVHYEYHVEGRRYQGQRTFPSREAAQPFLRADLPKMVWYDEARPSRSTLDE